MADRYDKIAGFGTDITIYEQTTSPLSYLIAPRTRPGRLGWIRWYGPWKQWCFFPCEGTVWSTDRLCDVAEFIWDYDRRVRWRARIIRDMKETHRRNLEHGTREDGTRNTESGTQTAADAQRAQR